MAFQQVSNPKDFPLRPLNGGMVLNRPSQMLEPGQCVDAQNVIVTENGPKRRPGYGLYGGVVDSYDTATRTPYRTIDMFNFWTSEVGELEQQMLLITAGPLYRVGFGGLEEVEWVYDTGTIDIAGAFVSGNGTVFMTGDVRAGDILRVGSEETRILETIGETSLRIEVGSLTNGINLPYQIVKSFNTDDRYLTDFVIYENQVIFTDFNRPLMVYEYDNAVDNRMNPFINEDDYMIDSGSGPEEFVATCLAIFQDRLFVGGTLEITDGLRRQRVRWSSATNARDFSSTTSWLDLPYTQGALRRLVPLGDTLIAYFDDAIFVGLPTNNPNLPVIFKRAETSSVGIVGSKAVARFLDGHFFIGQDDIYLMTGRGPERIGSPIVDRTIKRSKHKERCYVAVDPENDRVVFGFTETSLNMTALWSFNYKSRAWSYAPYSTFMIANPLSAFELSWDDLSGFTWSAGGAIGDSFSSWDSMVIRESSIPFYVEESGAIRKLGTGNTSDVISLGDGTVTQIPITMIYETGDFDFNDPDGNKTFIRLSMKVDFEAAPGMDVPFTIQGSWNRGRSWESLGTLRIKDGWDEGYVNFLLTSSHVRFRIQNSSMILPFTITEMVLKARLRGREITTGAQSP